jgi:hypothetical protein
MYDPARDIFTEAQPVESPPAESYQLSALDTLAGLAAQAEIASFPAATENVNQTVNDKVEIVKENGEMAMVQEEIVGVADNIEVDGGGGVEVARTKEPELTLKVTLHLKKDKKSKREEIPSNKTGEVRTEDQAIADLNLVAGKVESPGSPMRVDSETVGEPKEERKVDDTQEDPRNEKGDHSYPIPLSLSKLTKIPKRKVDPQDRRDKPDRESPDSRTPQREKPNRDNDRDRRRRPSPSPSYRSRSPSYRSRSPTRRLSDDRYRPSQHHVDSYRPSRDRDDHYVPSKRPRSPSPPRQLKRPVRRDVTATDRERERRERQQRDAERERADLQAARSRPVYETVRQHYNDREDRGREARQESRIYKLRKFNNWIKSVLIGKFIPERTEEQVDEEKGLFVLDIGCGKGGDLLKWQKQPQIQAYVGVDVADVSIIHAEQRAADLRGRRFSTRFFAMDCFVVCVSPPG